jgi:hypothetical protein
MNICTVRGKGHFVGRIKKDNFLQLIVLQKSYL